jgi:hypothetical protein
VKQIHIQEPTNVNFCLKKDVLWIVQYVQQDTTGASELKWLKVAGYKFKVKRHDSIDPEMNSG